MRVLHVTAGLSVAQGGLQSALLSICRAQAAAGITPAIAALHERAQPDPAFAAYETFLFPPLLRATGTSPSMRRWVNARAPNYDAVIAHSLWRAPLLYAARAATDGKLFVVAHGMLGHEALRQSALSKWLWLRIGLARALQRATVVYTCHAERDSAALQCAASTAVIPLSVAVPDTQPAPEGGPVVALGRIHPRKGTLEWVQALQLLADQGVEFHAIHAGPVGDRGYWHKVDRAAAALVRAGLLEFRGGLPHAQAQALLASARVVCAPCTVAENFAMVMFEAMALARPVLAGRRALMVPELERAGALCGTDATPMPMADALEELLADKRARTSLADTGYAWVRANLAPGKIGHQWRQLLENTSGGA